MLRYETTISGPNVIKSEVNYHSNELKYLLVCLPTATLCDLRDFAPNLTLREP